MPGLIEMDWPVFQLFNETKKYKPKASVDDFWGDEEVDTGGKMPVYVYEKSVNETDLQVI